ncbi:MAG: ABC transporter ATP-binding protein, partial [Hyphomicrobiales bacterium]|nr:ABC transporter ATP-binding protein [Hyphomicrobiales bacterium]
MPIPAFLSRLSQLKNVKGSNALALIVRLLSDQGVKHWRGYAFAMAATVVVAATTTLSAWIIKDVINQIFVAKKLSSVWLISGAIVAIYAVKGFSTYGQTVVLAKVANNIVADVQSRIFR